jgi:hypothetical protein
MTWERIFRIAEHLLGSLRPWPLTIVTGADSSHAKSLGQLILSIRRHEPNARVVVYDLGLTPGQRAEIERLAPRAIVRTFEFSRYPDWFNIRVEAGQYAWKPVLVEEVMRESRGPVVWLDAGDTLRGKLSQIYARTIRTGFYSPVSPGDLEKWTHEGTLAYFGLDRAWARGKRNVNGACVAFCPWRRPGAAVARAWSASAQIREAIAPPGSSRLNHRQDQALLGVLAHRARLVPRREERCPQLKFHCDID